MSFRQGMELRERDVGSIFCYFFRTAGLEDGEGKFSSEKGAN